MNKYIVLMDTICQGKRPACIMHDDGKAIPQTFDTLKEAQSELLEFYQTMLEFQIKEFEEGWREFEDIDLQCDTWVEPCSIDQDGTICLEDGTEFEITESEEC